jgi:hypothetical protein
MGFLRHHDERAVQVARAITKTSRSAGVCCCAKLLAVSHDALAEESSVRPVIAAKILGLSGKTVRAC